MTATGMKLGREDYKKKKELEEFRKLGAAPAEVDEHGFTINPHIPQYMAEAPHYLSTGRPGLQHQRLILDPEFKPLPFDFHLKKGYKVSNQNNQNSLQKKKKNHHRNTHTHTHTHTHTDDTDSDSGHGNGSGNHRGSHSRGSSSGGGGGGSHRRLKWKKGDCENCGSATHKTRDCCERPRKRPAKFSHLHLMPDEYLPSVQLKNAHLSYDAKRDHWQNYNIANYRLVIERHAQEEEERRRKKAKELDFDLLHKQQLKLEKKEKKEKEKLRRKQLKQQQQLQRKKTLKLKRKKEKKKKKKNALHANGDRNGSTETDDNENGVVDDDGDQDIDDADDNEDENENEEDGDDDDDDDEEEEEVDEVDSDDSDSDSDVESDVSNNDGEDDMRDTGQVIQRFDSKHRQTIRNLRIREDIPKYLLNLYSEAYYDPKTRSMRANPYSNTEFEEEKLYRGDNAMRHSGDAIKFLEMNHFAGVSRKINGEVGAQSVHLPSNPTLAEKTYKAVLDKKSDVKQRFDQKILDKYGGSEYLLPTNPLSAEKKLIYGVSEEYRVYAADGRIIKKQDEFIPKSKYEEDIYPGQHLSVWGSFFNAETNEWGYKCCKQPIYNSYCTAKTCMDAEYVMSLKQSDYGNIGSSHSSKHNGKAHKKRKRRRNADESADDADDEHDEHESGGMSSSNHNKMLMTNNQFSVALKPKDYSNQYKKVNPSGYVSTKGIMANARLNVNKNANINTIKTNTNNSLKRLRDMVQNDIASKKKRKMN